MFHFDRLYQFRGSSYALSFQRLPCDVPQNCVTLTMCDANESGLFMSKNVYDYI